MYAICMGKDSTPTASAGIEALSLFTPATILQCWVARRESPSTLVVVSQSHILLLECPP